MITRTCLCLVVRPGPVVRPGAVVRPPHVVGPTEAGESGGPREVLLGFKKTGFGAGRWVGLGGHIEDGEKPAEAAAREVAEESSLIVSELVHMASLNFVFPARPAWNQTADVFVTADYAGEAAESDEVIPRWFGADALPFDGMWDDARYWMPLVLAGERVCADITFADDCATVATASPDLLSGHG